MTTTPPDRAVLMELGARVEAATGPDWRLGQEIALAVGWREEDYDEIGEEPGTIWVQPNGRRDMLPNFTASLDAAMLLVPEGWSGKITFHPDGESWADVWRLGEIIELSDGLIRPYAPGGSPIEAGPTATPALALTAACLKALALQQGGSDGRDC